MTLQYQPLLDKCIPPEQATPESVGYDLFMPIDFRIKPKACKVIFLDYALGIPEGDYRRITSKSSLALNYSIDVKAGVVDRGYRGNIGVILKNDSEVPFRQKRGETYCSTHSGEIRYTSGRKGRHPTSHRAWQ